MYPELTRDNRYFNKNSSISCVKISISEEILFLLLFRTYNNYNKSKLTDISHCMQ